MKQNDRLSTLSAEQTELLTNSPKQWMGTPIAAFGTLEMPNEQGTQAS